MVLTVEKTTCIMLEFRFRNFKDRNGIFKRHYARARGALSSHLYFKVLRGT